MRLHFFFWMACLAAAPAFAQQKNGENIIDFDLAIGRSQGTMSAAFIRDWRFGRNNRIVVGFGGRLTAYAGSDQRYVTAPAELTSGGRGPLVIFTKNIVANMDTLFIAKANVFAVNALIDLGYHFSDRFSAGFNIDAVGISFGRERAGTYINGAQSQTTHARPTSFNALLVSDNDRGSLNSELYARYKIGQRTSVRAGGQFLFTEYTTDTAIQQFPAANDRFRKKSLMFMIGLSYKLK